MSSAFSVSSFHRYFFLLDFVEKFICLMSGCVKSGAKGGAKLRKFESMDSMTRKDGTPRVVLDKGYVLEKVIGTGAYSKVYKA